MCIQILDMGRSDIYSAYEFSLNLSFALNTVVKA